MLNQRCDKMKNRRELLKDLINLSGSINQIVADLSSFGYDFNEDPEILNYKILKNVLEKVINGEFQFELIEMWADAIEIRDDIDFIDEDIKDFIYEIANPAINGPVTIDRVKEMIEACGE